MPDLLSLLCTLAAISAFRGLLGTLGESYFICIPWVLLVEALVCIRQKACLERSDQVYLVPYYREKQKRENDKNWASGIGRSNPEV